MVVRPSAAARSPWASLPSMLGSGRLGTARRVEDVLPLASGACDLTAAYFWPRTEGSRLSFIRRTRGPSGSVWSLEAQAHSAQTGRRIPSEQGLCHFVHRQERLIAHGVEDLDSRVELGHG